MWSHYFDLHYCIYIYKTNASSRVSKFVRSDRLNRDNLLNHNVLWKANTYNNKRCHLQQIVFNTFRLKGLFNGPNNRDIGLFDRDKILNDIVNMKLWLKLYGI